MGKGRGLWGTLAPGDGMSSPLPNACCVESLESRGCPWTEGGERRDMPSSNGPRIQQTTLHPAPRFALGLVTTAPGRAGLTPPSAGRELSQNHPLVPA